MNITYRRLKEKETDGFQYWAVFDENGEILSSHYSRKSASKEARRIKAFRLGKVTEINV